uniref:Uncharacterized protein n=1 Tax=Anopheles quadriannulatus TaxID=34691 RepID=A0A182XPH3_ANOQN
MVSKELPVFSVDPAECPIFISHYEYTTRRSGRLVHLIKTQIERVRKISAPQTDKLDSLVEYGEAVQCMVNHMVAAGECAHITNPFLLQEVRWSHHIRGMTPVDLSTFSNYMEDLAEDAARLTTIDSPEVCGTSKGRPTKGYVHTYVNSDQLS